MVRGPVYRVLVVGRVLVAMIVDGFALKELGIVMSGGQGASPNVPPKIDDEPNGMGEPGLVGIGLLANVSLFMFAG